MSLPILALAATPYSTVEAARAHGRVLVALLPVGSVEAHGPHLPLATDTIIANELAVRTAQLVADERVLPCLLPALPYAPAEYAKAFAGTLSIRPETLKHLVADVAAACAGQGFQGLVLVNGHLEPDHVRNLRAAAAEARTASGLRFLLAPEWTSARYRPLLPEEFFAGGAHAGGYETSLVLAAEPDVVDEEARAALPANRTDLAAAMKAGARRFDELPTGKRAYFGDPARATAREGSEIYERLAKELAKEIGEEIAR